METRRVAYETARLRLARYRVQGAQARTAAAEHATRVSSEALDVERVGVWLLRERGQVLVCTSLYLRSQRERSAGQRIEAQNHPRYFAALSERRVIAADDALTHPDTVELTDTYLRPLGITSMLDAPIIRDGRAVGVVCHEHVGSPRRWSSRELEFAIAVADALALALEQSDRLELEAALQEQAEQRMESQRMEALGRMACAVAHDFNNLMGTLALAAGAAAYGEVAPEVKELAQEIDEVVEMGKRLTYQLLAFGKQRGEEPLSSVDLQGLLRRMLPMFRTAIGRGVALELDAPSALDTHVAGDPSQLEQVILNLILNARDAINGPGGQITLRLREATTVDEAPPDSIVLEVHDDGVGMDEETRARVFEPFFTTKTAGTGLGLATAYGVVRRSGGIMRVMSEPGRGTTVQVALPRSASS